MGAGAAATHPARTSVARGTWPLVALTAVYRNRSARHAVSPAQASPKWGTSSARTPTNRTTTQPPVNTLGTSCFPWGFPQRRSLRSACRPAPIPLQRVAASSPQPPPGLEPGRWELHHWLPKPACLPGSTTGASRPRRCHVAVGSTSLRRQNLLSISLSFSGSSRGVVPSRQSFCKHAQLSFAAELPPVFACYLAERQRPCGSARSLFLILRRLVCSSNLPKQSVVMGQFESASPE